MFQHSNCCNAGVYENTDICMSCKEHCEVLDENVMSIHRAYQDAINAVDMMTAMLEDLRDNLKEFNNYQKSPVSGRDTEKGNHENSGLR